MIVQNIKGSKYNMRKFLSLRGDSLSSLLLRHQTFQFLMSPSQSPVHLFVFWSFFFSKRKERNCLHPGVHRCFLIKQRWRKNVHSCFLIKQKWRKLLILCFPFYFFASLLFFFFGFCFSYLDLLFFLPFSCFFFLFFLSYFATFV